jgi:RNA polymerase sigma-70 factor (ECF subfamily)
MEQGAASSVTRLAFAAQRGDRAALALMVQRTQADIWRFCAHLRGRDHADDLTQETYSRAIASLHRFRGESDVRSWLLTIARRVCADQVRAEIRRRNLLGRLRPVPETHEPSNSVELWGVIGSLHGERREAFVLTQILGLSYEEAAQVCACPIGTIRSRVARARAELINQMDAAQAQSEAHSEARSAEPSG